MHRRGRQRGETEGGSIVVSLLRRQREKQNKEQRKEFAHPPSLTRALSRAQLLTPKQALKDAGVDEVVLAINYQPQVRLSTRKKERAKLQKKNERHLRPRALSLFSLLSLPSQHWLFF